MTRTYDIATITARLEYLRGELRAERISYGELAELQGLVPHIPADDVELLEAAGVPEFPGECEECGTPGVDTAYKGADGRSVCDDCRENSPA